MALNLIQIDPKAGAKAAVVEVAETILDLAKSGELTDLSYAAACLDGSVKTGYTATDDSHRRLAAVSRLLYRLHSAMDD